MISKVCGVLYYLIVAKFVTMISKIILEPWLQKQDYTDIQIERFILAIEVIEIAFLLTLLKGYDDI